MAQTFRDNCDECSKDYEFDKGRDIAYLCLTDSSANHIIATCPHCENVSKIFAEPEVFMAVMAALKLPLRISTEPDDELLEMMATLGLSDEDNHTTPYASDSLYHTSGTTHDLPEPPRDWLYELYDSMRHFGGECGPKCLFPRCTE